MIEFTLDDLKALLEQISTNALLYTPGEEWEAHWLTHYEIEAMLDTVIQNPPSRLTPRLLAQLKILAAAKTHTHFRRRILAQRLLKEITNAQKTEAEMF